MADNIGAGNKKVAVQLYDDKNQQTRLIPQDYQAFTLDTAFPVTNGIYVGETGDVAVVTVKGTTIVIPNVQAGTTQWGQFTQINTSGTSVADPEDNIRLIY